MEEEKWLGSKITPRNKGAQYVGPLNRVSRVISFTYIKTESQSASSQMSTHLVSTIITRRRQSSASMREISRIAVVFPTPGRPSSKMELPPRMRSAAIAALPRTARPTRHVSPTTFPARLRMQLILCSVLSMPALLSSPKSPT